MACPHSRKEKTVMQNAFFNKRQQSVRQIIDANQLDSILFTSLESIRYLCGFTGSDGALLLSSKETFYLTDSRYWTQAEEEVKQSRIVHYKKKLEGIAALISDLNLKKVGVEGPFFALSSYHFLTEKLGNETEFISLEDEIKNLRAAKDLHELALTRNAIDLSTRSFSHIMEFLREGVVEKEVALEMEFFIKKNGAESTGFDIIIASGQRSALPHGRAGNKRIERGDFILIDFGLRLQGYHSDQTRTLVCEKSTPEQAKVYQVVKEAHDMAIEAIRPCIPICEIDRIARDHIKQQGYGDYFGHGLGHGIGLAVHEDPVVNGENKGLIEEGMVFTVEPGIYIPNWGGVRIEDMILVTPQGAEVLTYLPRELTII
ncbi:MAG: aminopeptidase P family protein [Deltaproteobacteria bacterium]|nr:aminopeptidase P family protein [Deltaproteobacteria bacterium]